MTIDQVTMSLNWCVSLCTASALQAIMPMPRMKENTRHVTMSANGGIAILK